MSGERNAFDIMVEECANVITYLQEVIGDPASEPLRLLYFLRELGWNIPVDTDLSGVNLGVISKIALINEALSGDELDYPRLLTAVFDAFDAIKGIPDQLNLNLGADFTESLRDNLPKKIVDYIITQYLEYEHPKLFNLLVLLGIFNVEYKEAETSIQVGHIRREIDWEFLSEVLSEPNNIANTVYGWGSSDFRSDLLLEGLHGLMNEIGVPAGHFDVDSTVQTKFNIEKPSLDIPLVDWSDFQVGLEIYPLPPDSSSNDAGLGVSPYLVGSTEKKIEINESLNLEISSSLTLDKTTGFTIRPGKGLKFYALSDSSVSEGTFKAILNIKPADTKIFSVNLSGSRLEVPELAFSLGASTENGLGDTAIEMDIRRGSLAISTDEGDGFIQKILPRDGIKADFDLTIGLSSHYGIYFQGSAALEVTIPVHRSIGPVKLESVYLAIKPQENGGIPIVLAASAGVQIGPIATSVQRIGVKTALSFPREGGNLGPIQLDPLRFLPPTGVGLVVDAGPVVGGGYLEIDTENKRYAGILQLKFGDIGLTAIGLITTRMPDGTEGFSMLMIITAEFNPPIQLPYGFTLSGVGGLVGIHRTMVVDVLRQGIKNRTLDSIMFPEDPILNGPRIISDLRAVFPPTVDRYVFGPMAIIGWGTPPLITAEIGILIELPNPIRIAILGQITAELPKKEAAIVELHMDVLGILDFDKRTFSLDATLYDSRILAFTLTGDMAMRLSWGDRPNFAMSVGGLNPRFPPPPNFPSLNRLMLSLGSGNNPRINLSCYMALTSNSTQFGARLEVYAKKGIFNIQGYMGFDALFIFSPFSFVVEIGAGVALRKRKTTLMSITLDLMLSGPTPWRAKGKATFKILFVKKKIRFDESWGRREAIFPPAVEPWPLLKAALEDPGNWAGVLPEETEMAVSLRKIEGATSNMILVYPIGTLEVRQRVLPLNLKLTKFGNAPVTGKDIFNITKVESGNVSLGLNPLKEYFARYQYEEGSDQDKLSRPSFEKLDAGVAIGSDEIAFKFPVPYELEYETEVIDENKVTVPLGLTPLSWRMGKVFVAGSAASTGLIRKTGFRKFHVRGKAAKVGIVEEGYAIVGSADLKIEEDIPDNGGALTHVEASRKLEAYLESHPDKKGELQIVPQYEVAT